MFSHWYWADVALNPTDSVCPPPPPIMKMIYDPACSLSWGRGQHGEGEGDIFPECKLDRQVNIKDQNLSLGLLCGPTEGSGLNQSRSGNIFSNICLFRSIPCICCNYCVMENKRRHWWESYSVPETCPDEFRGTQTDLWLARVYLSVSMNAERRRQRREAGFSFLTGMYVVIQEFLMKKSSLVWLQGATFSRLTLGKLWGRRPSKVLVRKPRSVQVLNSTTFRALVQFGAGSVRSCWTWFWLNCSVNRSSLDSCRNPSLSSSVARPCQAHTSHIPCLRNVGARLARASEAQCVSESERREERRCLRTIKTLNKASVVLGARAEEWRGAGLWLRQRKTFSSSSSSSNGASAAGVSNCASVLCRSLKHRRHRRFGWSGSQDLKGGVSEFIPVIRTSVTHQALRFSNLNTEPQESSTFIGSGVAGNSS